MPLAGGDVADGLSEMALAGAAGAGDEDGDLFRDEAPGGQVVNEAAVEVGQPAELDTVSDYALRLGAVSFFRKENHLGAMTSAMINCLVFKVN